MVEKWRTKWEEFSDNSWSERFCEHGSWRSFGDEGTVRELFSEIDRVFSEFWWDKNPREVVGIVLRKCRKMIIFLCLVVTGTMVFFFDFFQKQLGNSSSQLTPFFFQRGRSTTNQIWVNIPWSSQGAWCIAATMFCMTWNHMKSHSIWASRNSKYVHPFGGVFCDHLCVFSFLMLSYDFYPWLVWCFLPVVLPRLFHDFSMLYFACCLMFHVRFLHNVWCSKHTYNFFWIPISSHNVSWFLIFPHFFFRLSMFFPLVVPPETFGTPAWAR